MLNRKRLGEFLILLIYLLFEAFGIWPLSHFWSLITTIVGVLALLFLDGGFSERQITSVAVVLVIISAFIDYSIPRPEPEKWRGWLQPANDPTPVNGCDSAVLLPPDVSPAKDAAIMVIGHMGVRLISRPGKSRAISIGRCESLALERGPNGIRVSAALYDAAGNPLGEIIDNGYKIPKENALIVEHSGDLSTLVVHHEAGAELLYVHYANSHAIKVRGIFNCPSLSGTVSITDSEIRAPRGLRFGDACMTDVAYGFCLMCSN